MLDIFLGGSNGDVLLLEGLLHQVNQSGHRSMCQGTEESLWKNQEYVCPEVALVRGTGAGAKLTTPSPY